MASVEDSHDQILKRRARRFAGNGEYRKAALALRERVALTGDAASWVALGEMLSRARRIPDALAALRQGMYLHRRAGAEGRARTVARMIVALDPWDAKAARAGMLEERASGVLDQGSVKLSRPVPDA